MPPALVFNYRSKFIRATIETPGRKLKGIEARKFLTETYANAEDTCSKALPKFELVHGTYDFRDEYGNIEEPEDLLRAVKMSEEKGEKECNIIVKEHHHIVRISELQEEQERMNDAMNKMKAFQDKEGDRTAKSIEEHKTWIMKKVDTMQSKLDELEPAVVNLRKGSNEQEKRLKHMDEKLAGIDIQELKEMTIRAKSLQEEVKNCIKKVDNVDSQFQREKKVLKYDVQHCQQELNNHHQFMQGKLNIMMEADADLRRENQLLTERLGLTQDDMRLLQEELQHLKDQCTGALEESEQLRTTLGSVNEDNKHLRHEQKMVVERVNCIEGTASEKWEGFAPGVLYFRYWHHAAKGRDVNLNADHTIGTGRGFLAATGVVLGSDEGMCVANGPCRRFGTPGQFSSYYEIEVDEVCAAPMGAGGMYIGFSIQSSEEIAAHPKHEFDGWLMGGQNKALICLASQVGDEDPMHIPATFAVGLSGGPTDEAVNVSQMLRMAMGSRPKGEVREVGSFWASQELRMGDRVGCLFRCNRDSGARMKISVNGTVRATHDFMDAPPAEYVGFLTPIIRLAGTGKSAKIHPGLIPPSSVLAD